jgi:prepilin-type N-terminal cleavage/methylation domain-containing protein
MLLISKVMRKRESGFTLFEVMVALVIFAAALGGLVPLFMISRAYTLKSDSRIGATAVAQQIMDSLRQQDISTLPNSGTDTKLPTASQDSLAALPYKGKTYSATITYCQNKAYCGNDPQGLPDTVHLIVSVYQDGNTSTTPVHTVDPIYQLETVYTKLNQ